MEPLLSGSYLGPRQAWRNKTVCRCAVCSLFEASLRFGNVELKCAAARREIAHPAGSRVLSPVREAPASCSMGTPVDLPFRAVSTDA